MNKGDQQCSSLVIASIFGLARGLRIALTKPHSALTAAAGFAVTPPEKWSVMDLSFHLQSPANSLQRALSSQIPRNPNQRGIDYDADHTHPIKA